MKILFDHQFLSYQDYGGVSKYFFELYSHFIAENQVDIPIGFSNSDFLKSLNLSAHPFFPHKAFVGKRFAMNLLNIPYSRYKIKREDYDVFHPTYFSPYFVEINQKPSVITVHDLIYDLFPQYFKSYDFSKRSNKEKCFNAVDAIIAVSENTKRDLVKLYQIPEEKITVIHHGVNQSFVGDEELKQVEDELHLKSFNYILYVGSRKAYKNFLFTITSLHETLLKNKLKLVCIGGGAFSDIEINEFKCLGIDSLVMYIDFSEAALKWLYSNAFCFIFPSLYEGFGMPVLEAYANNCPVVLSNRSCFPEVAGEAALYFEPDDESSIAYSIDKLLDDSILRNELTRLGKERLKSFSWDRTASETLKLYRKIIENK